MSIRNLAGNISPLYGLHNNIMWIWVLLLIICSLGGELDGEDPFPLNQIKSIFGESYKLIKCRCCFSINALKTRDWNFENI